MNLTNKTNSTKSIILKNAYTKWKKDQLDNSSYFIIFKEFLSPELLKKISGNSLKLYLYLGLNSNNITGEVWHGVNSIAEYFNKSDRTIRTWLRELQDLGLIYRMQLDFNGKSYNYLLPYYSKKINDKNVIRYRLKDSKLRKLTDLNDFSNSINKGIKSIFPSAKINVFKELFIIYLDFTPTSTELRKMGYEIKSRDYRFNELVKQYKYFDKKTGKSKKSVQLFQRIT